MDIQYLHDETGKTTAVLVPIEDWKVLTEGPPTRNGELPQWQKDMLDERLQFIKDHPDKMIPMEEFEKLLEDADEDL